MHFGINGNIFDSSIFKNLVLNPITFPQFQLHRNEIIKDNPVAVRNHAVQTSTRIIVLRVAVSDLTFVRTSPPVIPTFDHI
jgi:hypothetical protein